MDTMDRAYRIKHLVLVQSDPTLAPIIKGRLEAAGFTLELAPDVHVAMEMAQPGRARVDLLLVDLLQASGSPLPPSNLGALKRCAIPQIILYPTAQPELVEKATNRNTMGILDREADAAVIESSLDAVLRILEEKILFQDAWRYSTHGVSLHRLILNPSSPIDCEFLQVNDAFERQTGVAAKDVLGKTLRDVVPEPEVEDLLGLIHSAIRGGKPVRGEYRFEQEQSWFELFVNPIDETRLTVFLENVTERKRAEKKLRESELYFRSVVDSGLVLIWTSGTDGNCDFFNTPWLEFRGRTLEEEVGNGWTLGVHPDDLERCVGTYSQAFGRRERFDMEYRLRHASGEYRWIQDVGTPRYGADGEFLGYIGHCLDITERKTAEMKALKKLDELERFHRVTANRELRMVELKKEINQLAERLGEGPRYRITDLEAGKSP